MDDHVIFYLLYTLQIYVVCRSSNCIFMLHYRYDHALILHYPTLLTPDTTNWFNKKQHNDVSSNRPTARRQWFLLHLELPLTGCSVGHRLVSGGGGLPSQMVYFFRRTHVPSPWNRFRATWYFYICLLNVYWFSHWPSLTTCTLMSFINRFVFTVWFFQFLPKTKNTCYSGACGACTFGRMQIGWILHKVCSFVGTGRALHQSRYSSYASFLAGSVGPFSKHSLSCISFNE